jgi:hypothetical protein
MPEIQYPNIRGGLLDISPPLKVLKMPRKVVAQRDFINGNLEMFKLNIIRYPVHRTRWRTVFNNMKQTILNEHYECTAGHGSRVV